MMQTTPLLRAIRLAALALSLGGPALLGALPAQAQSETSHYDIPAGPLGTVLSQFAAASGVMLTFGSEQTGNQQSNGLHGNYSLEQGFAHLLQGSDLQVQKTGERRYVLVTPGSGSLDLGTTSITGLAPNASALVDELPGGLQARGGRAGLLGNKDTMDLPFSISSYTERFLKNQRAVTVADALAYDASVSISQTGGMVDSYAVRGFPYAEGNVGEMTFDGVYGVAPNYRVFTQYAERIEVFKGASGLLYGMSPDSGVGGVINIVPKRAPDAGLLELTGSYSGESSVGGHIDVGQRFGADKRFGIRVNAAHEQGDTGIDNQHRELSVGSLALDYRGERLTATLDAIVQNEKWDAPSRVYSLASGLKVPGAPDGETNPTQKWGWSEMDDRSLLLGMEYQLHDDFEVFANVGNGFSRVDRSYDQLLSITNAAGDISSTQRDARFEVERDTASLGFRTRFDTAAIKHELSVQASQFQVTNYLSLNNGVTLQSNIYDPVYYPEQTPASAGSAPRVSETELSGVALADTLSVLDERVQLILGLRQQRVTSDNWDRVTRVRGTPYSDRALTPSAGLIFRPTPNTMLYASYIEGLSKGDVAPSTASNAGETLAPYESEQYEVGFKVDYRNLNASISAFQITKPSGQLDGTVYRAGAEQRNRGIELNVQGEASAGLRLLSGVTLLDAELTRTGNTANEGNQAVGAPRLQAKLGVEWDTPWLAGFTPTAGIIHVGKQYIDQANSAHLPAWTRFDFGARYVTDIGDQQVTFRANLQNAFNRNYWSGVSQWSAFSLGAPRTLSLSTSIAF
ncbi:TonB-dependent receptor [Pseudomonas sp. ABC1]|uniref:TonB-dependent receptor n=1 Tax=Pseudomonas sp. ABC1 TaxID=2748080 RepID=UPI0015C31F46|nr:TonB-dependent receptor [Pseudomonas sp. ABC1]QLF93324.1 TonB-dependent receptor [Pseudomonas sp. ABC1]